MLQIVRLTDIAFRPELPALLKKMRIDQRPEYAERFTRLVEQAVQLARPKAAYGLSSIDERSDEAVIVDGVTLTSRVLSVNLAKVHRVFPFLITCGKELENWSQSVTDMLEKFWADAIMEDALRSALDALKASLAERYQLGHSAMMNPGSLPDWPIDQQQPLFHILGDLSEQVGVKLTDTFIMVPIKSVSGLLFPTEAHYENCQLCPRERCPGRRAPYDEKLYQQRYAMKH